MTKLVLLAWAAALIVVAIRRPDRLLAAAILCAPFEGAAIVNAGGIGVSPYFFALMLIACRCPFVRTDASSLMGRAPAVRLAMRAAVALLLIGVVGAILLPRVFAGTPVNSPRLDADATSPLVGSTSNVGQCVYLLLNVAFLWHAAQSMATRDAARSAVLALAGAGAIVVFFAFYQFAGAVAGLPYPADVLYSNESVVMQHGSTILDMPRIGSTFTEPAGMAVFLVGFGAFAIARLAGGGASPARVVLLAGTVAAIALSTSSTAFVGLAGLAAWAVAAHLILPVVRGTARPRRILTVVVPLAAVVVAIASSGTIRDMIRKVVFEKGDSDSFDGRSAADAIALGLARATLGLGVGLGSNRASSFAPSMLSTVGVPGVAAFATLVVSLCRRAGGGELDALRRAAAAGLVATVAVKCVSSPDLVTPLMWSFAATLIVIHGAAATDATTVVAIGSMSSAPAFRRRRLVSA